MRILSENSLEKYGFNQRKCLMLSNGVDSFLKAYLVKNLIKKLISVKKWKNRCKSKKRLTGFELNT